MKLGLMYSLRFYIILSIDSFRNVRSIVKIATRCRDTAVPCPYVPWNKLSIELGKFANTGVGTKASSLLHFLGKRRDRN
jgi:hypothetical protein